MVSGRCGQSGYFDKEGFNEARVLQCPAKGCAHVWCKRCQQEVDPNGPEHSCNGSPPAEPAQKPLLQRGTQGWTFGFSWSSIRTRVDVNASVRPRDVRVQLVSTTSNKICLTQRAFFRHFCSSCRCNKLIVWLVAFARIAVENINIMESELRGTHGPGPTFLLVTK